jgi:carbonic anhydrase
MHKFDRRSFLGAATALPLVGLIDAATADECSVFDRARQEAKTPDQALARLLEGNARFVAGDLVECDLMAQVKDTASGQAPFAAVLSCMDSRVPPELVLDQRIGDIFVVRIAGNFANTDIIGSMEFAAKVAGSRLIMVLGHSECGAIRGAIDNVQLGNLTATLSNILPAVEETNGVPGELNSKNAALVQAVAENNARLTAKLLTERSAILNDLIEEGSLRIVAAMHNVSTGRVTVLE